MEEHISDNIPIDGVLIGILCVESAQESRLVESTEQDDPITTSWRCYTQYVTQADGEREREISADTALLCYTSRAIVKYDQLTLAIIKTARADKIIIIYKVSCRHRML